MDKCPCKNCIVVAICRHRTIDELMCNCQLVIDYTEFINVSPETSLFYEFHESDNYNFDRLIEVFRCLTPTGWTLDDMYSGR